MKPAASFTNLYRYKGTLMDQLLSAAVTVLPLSDSLTPSSSPDVRYSGRVCAAGCRLTLFKTMITSRRLVLQPSTPGAPTTDTPTDRGTRQNDWRIEPSNKNRTFNRENMNCVCFSRCVTLFCYEGQMAGLIPLL